MVVVVVDLIRAKLGTLNLTFLGAQDTLSFQLLLTCDHTCSGSISMTRASEPRICKQNGTDSAEGVPLHPVPRPRFRRGSTGALGKCKTLQRIAPLGTVSPKLVFWCTTTATQELDNWSYVGESRQFQFRPAKYETPIKAGP